MFVPRQPEDSVEFSGSRGLEDLKESGALVALSSLDPGRYNVFRLCPADAFDFSYSSEPTLIVVLPSGRIRLRDDNIPGMGGTEDFTFRIDEPEWIIVDRLKLADFPPQGLNRTRTLECMNVDETVREKCDEIQWDDLQVGEGVYGTGMRGDYGVIEYLCSEFCIVSRCLKSTFFDAPLTDLGVIHKAHLGDRWDLHLYSLVQVNANLNSHNESVKTSENRAKQVVAELFSRNWQGCDDDFMNLLGNADELAYKCGQMRMYLRVRVAREQDWAIPKDAVDWLEPWSPPLGMDLVSMAMDRSEWPGQSRRKPLESISIGRSLNPKIRDITDADLTGLFDSPDPSELQLRIRRGMEPTRRLHEEKKLESKADSTPEDLDPDDENDPVFGKKATNTLGGKLSALFGIGNK